jgi:REP element-mobilizing transposase RayT
MPRNPRIEIAGGLYHVVTRGNNRRKIFRSHDDYLRFTSILERQKAKLPFYLYAYCLMPNHVHLLIEMQDDPLSRIMQRVLTTYSQHHNRKYNKIGHLFQGRYKSILCQTDRYLGELVRYIHLNPVRARMVRRPEDYEYSGHRAYLGLDKTELVDAEPVLRHFGASRRRAVETYIRFVESSLAEQRQEQYYRAAEGRLLGSEEFVKEVARRIGDHRSARQAPEPTSIDEVLIAAEICSGLSRQELSSKSKNRRTVAAKEAVIVLGREMGITNRVLAEALGLGASAVTRRVEAARARGTESSDLVKLRKLLRSRVGLRQMSTK